MGFEEQPNRHEMFWGEIAPCEHMAQFYEHDNEMLDTLGGFIGGGLKAGDGAIVIATTEHLSALRQRLQEAGVDVATALGKDQYIPLDAEESLARFTVKHWPDEQLFEDFVTELLIRARGNGRRVRAFGEMVALLWAKGEQAATVRLEYIWHKVCEQSQFSLLCAYPKSGFTKETSTSFGEICAAHSMLV